MAGQKKDANKDKPKRVKDKVARKSLSLQERAKSSS